MTSSAIAAPDKTLILVVEDEAIIAMDIAMQLRDLGYEPLGPAASGEQAIEIAGKKRPDLVLMDIHLASAMDGFTAALALRSQFDLPCVFLSAFESGASLQRARLAAPAGYLAKPFTDYELRTVIEAALQR